MSLGAIAFNSGLQQDKKLPKETDKDDLGAGKKNTEAVLSEEKCILISYNALRYIKNYKLYFCTQ
jgi:hypothetical protein